MITGLVIFHVVVCVLLTVTVLVQFGKGAEAGAMMGSGSSQAIFTTSSKGNFFTKMTTVLAVTFMVNSVVLTVMSSKDSKESLFDDEAPIAQPLNTDAMAPKTEAAAPKAEAKKEET